MIESEQFSCYFLLFLAEREFSTDFLAVRIESPWQPAPRLRRLCVLCKRSLIPQLFRTQDPKPQDWQQLVASGSFPQQKDEVPSLWTLCLGGEITALVKNLRLPTANYGFCEKIEEVTAVPSITELYRRLRQKRRGPLHRLPPRFCRFIISALDREVGPPGWTPFSASRWSGTACPKQLVPLRQCPPAGLLPPLGGS